MADLVYPPVIVLVKSLWKYLGLQFTFQGEAHVPRKGGAILAMNHIGYLDFAIVGTAVLPANRLVRFMAKKEIFDHKIYLFLNKKNIFIMIMIIYCFGWNQKFLDR